MKIRKEILEVPAAALPLSSSPSKKIFFFLFLSLSLAAAASAAAEGPAVPGRIEQLAFMAGTWSTPAGDFEIEELWMPPKGGLMLGLGRTTKLGKALEFEFMRIEQQGPTLVYPPARTGSPPRRSARRADTMSAAFEQLPTFPTALLLDGTLTACSPRSEGVRDQAAEVDGWRRVEGSNGGE